MPQPLLPLIPEGATPICGHFSVVKENDTWTYFAGVLPIFSPRHDDRDSFRMFTAQLVCHGNCKQVDIVKLKIKPDTLRKAIRRGKLTERPRAAGSPHDAPLPQPSNPAESSDKSQRGLQDAAAAGSRPAGSAS